MTESQAGAAHDAVPDGDAGENGTPPNVGSAPTQDLSATLTGEQAAASSVATQQEAPPAQTRPLAQSQPQAQPPPETGRGSRRRTQWSSPAAGGDARNLAQEPGERRRMPRRSAWVLGSTAVLVLAVAAVGAVTLSSRGTQLSTAAATAKAATAKVAPSPLATSAGKLLPLATPTAKKAKKAAPAVTVTKTAVAEVPAAPPAPSKTPKPKATVSVPAATDSWDLNAGSGSSASDAMGSYPASGSNITWCDVDAVKCAMFNGTSSDFTTSGPVLNTGPGSSFTVSAWVDMTAVKADDGFGTVVSQDSAENSSFFLQYSGTDGRWSFSRVATDASGGTGLRALSKAAPTLNAWTHLVGVYDATDNQVRLYVNGALQDTVVDPTPFQGTGDLIIGRAQYDGTTTDWFEGAVSQVTVFNVALTTKQVGKS